MDVTIPSSQLREAIGRQTVRFRVSRLRRITARPFGLTTAGHPGPADGPFDPGRIDIVINGTPSRVGTVSFRDYLALSFPVRDAEVTVVSRHPLPDLPHFDLVADLEPFCAGWASFMEELSERLYGEPRPSLT